jgi:hypothetical protein
MYTCMYVCVFVYIYIYIYVYIYISICIYKYLGRNALDNIWCIKTDILFSVFFVLFLRICSLAKGASGTKYLNK